MKRTRILALTVTLGACASVGGMRSAPLTEGVPRTFAAGHTTVLNASREAVVEAGLAIDEVRQVNDRTWMIIAKKGASGFTWGELVRVVVQEESPSETMVRVYTQRRMATNVTAKGDYSDTIFQIIDVKLKAGG